MILLCLKVSFKLFAEMALSLRERACTAKDQKNRDNHSVLVRIRSPLFANE